MKRGDTITFDTKDFYLVKEKILEGEIQVIDRQNGEPYQLDIKVGERIFKHVPIDSVKDRGI